MYSSVSVDFKNRRSTCLLPYSVAPFADVAPDFDVSPGLVVKSARGTVGGVFVRVKVKVLVFDTRVAERPVSGEPEVAHVVGTFAPAFLHRDEALVLFSVVAAGIENKIFKLILNLNLNFIFQLQLFIAYAFYHF